jgi:hypothetical protein
MNAPHFAVLSCEASAASDGALCKFGEFLGLRAELITFPAAPAHLSQPQLSPAPGGRVLALGRLTLRRLMNQPWFVSLLNECRFIFVFGLAAPHDGESSELKWLTQGMLSSTAAARAQQTTYAVHSDTGFDTFAVSGRSYTTESPGQGEFCGVASIVGAQTCLSANGRPVFVCLKRGNAHVFLLAESELVDLDRPLEDPQSSLRPWYCQLIALSIFFRNAFGPWCWSSPVTPATFVLDDLYLRRRYGFVHYDALVRELVKAEAALTVAFIPYNYRRSESGTIDLLLRHADRFSIAVHGCDHTGGEFASTDTAWLTSTAMCAVDRMREHAHLTQMPFDNVMVFPQGRFSTAALAALKISGFNAAVNTSPWPEDVGANRPTIRDYLQIAVTRYAGVPIFVRRSPRDVFDFAFDALFQKPLLIGEHHGYFREGYGPFSQLMREFATLDARLAWMTLGNTVAATCTLKLLSDGVYAARHLAPLLRLKNPTCADIVLKLEKPESGTDVNAVIVGGRRVPFEIHNGRLTYEARLGVDEELSVSIAYRQVPRTERKLSWNSRLRVFTRRVLSDTRDNYLAQNEKVLLLAEKFKRALAKQKQIHR